jgi:hypothetical protein
MTLIEQQESSHYTKIVKERQLQTHPLPPTRPSRQQQESSINSSIKKQQIVEKVYSIIRDNSGKIRTADLDRIIGNKQGVRFAITRLTVIGRIRRKRGLGSSGIEYYYHDIYSQTSSKFTRMNR